MADEQHQAQESWGRRLFAWLLGHDGAGLAQCNHILHAVHTHVHVILAPAAASTCTTVQVVLPSFTMHALGPAALLQAGVTQQPEAQHIHHTPQHDCDPKHARLRCLQSVHDVIKRLGTWGTDLCNFDYLHNHI